MSGRLSGRTAAIIGAGQAEGSTLGNGRAIALRFAEEGARVLLVDRDRASVEATAAMLPRDACHVHICDIADDDGPASIADAARAAFGGLDILVNNVGIGHGRDAPVDQLDEDVWDLLMGVNLRAMYRTIRYALPLLREGDGGAIVNISSLAAIAPTPMISYGVSKAAVNRLTQSVAMHNAALGVRCNAIMPGLMDTPMAIEGIARREGKPADEIRERRSRMVPMGHMGQAIDTANAALFLASNEARFITGVLLAVDGGASVKLG
jgi:NAD(P)-dependent dehydrogenase (short-subunit alcohol dehydrogenase family)